MDLAVLAFAMILDRAIAVYIVVIVVRSILSWFRPNPRHPVVRFLYAVTDPVLNPVRDFFLYRLKLNLGGLDFSPVIVILALAAVRGWLVPWLVDLAHAF